MSGLLSVVSEAGLPAASVVPLSAAASWGFSWPSTGPFCSAGVSSLGSSTLGLGLVTIGLQAPKSSCGKMKIDSIKTEPTLQSNFPSAYNLKLTLVFALMSLTLTDGSTARLCLLCWFMALFIQIIASLFSLSTLFTSASSKWSYCSSWKSNRQYYVLCRQQKLLIVVLMSFKQYRVNIFKNKYIQYCS